MLFNSFTYIFFLIVVSVVRWLAGPLVRRLTGRPLLPTYILRASLPTFLLAASYLFYASWNPTFLILVIALSVFNYALGLALGSLGNNRGWQRQFLLIIGVVGNLSTLCYYKYAHFLLQQLSEIRHSLWGTTIAAAPDIILPLAISFFIFQFISYLVDVYRGEVPERSLIKLSLYISFFPHQIAGPIVRANELIPQFNTSKGFDPVQFVEGLELLAIGYLKKVCLADNLARWPDIVFRNPNGYGSMEIWVAALAYTGQIYCDFSGYTDIARGSAKLIGFELPINFDLPYLSANITQFWQRWHISLSRWLRDYIYIPLGGNRKGKFRQSFNLVITMGLGGLWHGANWTFVVWGLYHGLLLLLHKLFVPFRDRINPSKTLPSHWLYKVVCTLFTLHLVVLGWVLFRAPSFQSAMLIYSGWIAMRAGAPTIPNEMLGAVGLIAVLILGHLWRLLPASDRMYSWLPLPIKGIGWAAVVFVCYFTASSSAQFIYFQF